MEENPIKVYKYISIGFSAIIIGLAVVIYLVMYIHQDTTSKNPVIAWTVENHLPITIMIILLSGFMGYISSTLTYKQVTKTKSESKRLLEMLFLFLNNDEKEIVDHLVKNNGTAGQAEIARLPGMNRVKAFRSLQKMQSRNLLDIASYGKIRKISLKENILQMLMKE